MKQISKLFDCTFDCLIVPRRLFDAGFSCLQCKINTKTFCDLKHFCIFVGSIRRNKTTKINQQSKNQSVMENFNQLVANGYEGRFTYEPNELVEIHVDCLEGTIKVEHFRTKNHFLDPIKKEFFHSLYGMFGQLSVEEQFNEILKTIK